jgi:hypothetical protein
MNSLPQPCSVSTYHVSVLNNKRETVRVVASCLQLQSSSLFTVLMYELRGTVTTFPAYEYHYTNGFEI